MHNILVVDDNIVACKALAMLLTKLGDRAKCVCSGQLALDSIQLHVPYLVILDLMMPDMDGMDVLRRIRSNPHTARLPVVMFSALDDAETIDRAKAAGANDFWVKGTTDVATLHALVAPDLDLPAAA